MITDAHTTDAGETPAFSALQSAFGDGQASAAGATLTNNYYRLRKARKGERSAARQPPKALCSAKSAGVLACETLGVGNLTTHLAIKITAACTTDAGEDACFLG